MEKRDDNLIGRWRRDERGNVLMLTCLLLVVLVALSGMAIDLGRQQLVRIKLQQASDAAALAGALPPAGADPSTTALRYFNLNFPTTYMDIARPTPVIGISNGQVTVSANTTVSTLFMKFLGDNTVAATGASTVSANVNSNAQAYDLALSMDNSGSMATNDAGNGQTRIAALKLAAQTINTNLLGSTSGATNRIAAVTWSDKLLNTQALTSSGDAITTLLNGMVANGGTNSTLGLQQIQTWSGSMRNDAVKAVVMITDGENTNASPLSSCTVLPGKRTPSPTGLCDSSGCDGYDTCPTANASSLAICSALKAQNVVIYTVAFGQDVYTDTTAKNFLSACASGTSGGNLGTYFFIAPDSATLQATFANIVTSVKKLRITQ